MFKRAYCLIAVLLASVAPLRAEDQFTIGDPDTDTDTAIVIADDWKKQRWFDWGGHAILRRHVQLITGQRLPVVKAKNFKRARFPNAIWIGRQPQVEKVIGKQLNEIDDDGYIIHADKNNLYLAGKFWWGTNWAVHDVLERFAGCRWYLMEPRFWEPTKDGMVGPGDIVPQAETIRIPSPIRIVEEPDYKSRWFRITPYHSFRLRSRDQFHHALGKIVPPKELYKTNPEWFPLIKGKRYEPKHDQDWQPCISNKALTQFVAQKAIATFDNDLSRGSFSIGMNDTRRFCQCEPCLAIAPASIEDERARTAYAFFDFYNRVAALVAEKYPNKRLGCLAYAGLRSLPANSIKLHPILVPYLTLDSAQLHDADQQIEFQQSIQKWDAITTRMGIYEYMYGGGFVIPRIYNRYLFKNIKRQYNIGVDGFYAEAYPNWGLDGPKYWVATKLLWDTSLDPDQLLEQFYSDMFGPVSDKMRAYFDHLEEVWCTQTLKSDRSNYRWLRDSTQLQIFKPEDCHKAWRLINQAYETAPNDTIRKRIEYFRTSFNVTRLLCIRSHHAIKADELITAETPDWIGSLKQLDSWLTAKDLDSAVQAARELGYSAFSTTGTNELDRIDMYDHQPNEAIEKWIGRLTLEAALTKPTNAQEMKAAIQSQTSKLGTSAASEYLANITAKRGFIFVNRTATPPVIDGKIDEPSWGKPIFDGHLLNIKQMKGKTSTVVTRPDENATRIWMTRDDDTLYVAFDCEQEPQSIGADVTDRDTTFWRNPDMRRDDCVILNFAAGPTAGFQNVRINANGAVSDFHRNNLKFDAVLQSNVSRTSDGWQVELAISLAKLVARPGVDPTANPRVSIARFTRQGIHERTQIQLMKWSTLMPFAPGTGIIGKGNSIGTMVFMTGARLLFEE